MLKMCPAEESMDYREIQLTSNDASGYVQSNNWIGVDKQINVNGICRKLFQVFEQILVHLLH